MSDTRLPIRIVWLVKLKNKCYKWCWQFSLSFNVVAVKPFFTAVFDDDAKKCQPLFTAWDRIAETTTSFFSFKFGTDPKLELINTNINSKLSWWYIKWGLGCSTRYIDPVYISRWNPNPAFRTLPYISSNGVHKRVTKGIIAIYRHTFVTLSLRSIH